MLTDAQFRLLSYSASGGRIHSLRPGSNRAFDVEITYSDRGVGIFIDGDRVEELLRLGLLKATLKDVPEKNETLEVTHELTITHCGRAAIARAQPGKGE